MHTHEDISETYDDILTSLDENFVLNAFIFGFSMSMILFFITTQFIKKIPIYIIVIFSLLTSLFFGFFREDLTHVLNFLDIPISLIASFLFVRLCMSLSRTIKYFSSFEESAFHTIIISISFLSLSLAIFILYNTIKKVALVICIYFLNALVLVFTLILENGLISDASLVVAYSILFISKSEEYSTFISVIRFTFLFFSLISLLFKSKISKKEDIFLIVNLKKTRTRILLFLAISTYFYISPGLMWQHGYNRCAFQSIAAPILYLMFLFYESNNDQTLDGYR